MSRLFLSTLILSLFFPGVVCADFVNPASLEITELRASEFEIVFTLPLIQGRVLKARPIFPDLFVIHGEADERVVSGSVVRTWSMTCDPDDLVGAPIGVSGLLGTSQEILLTIKTLAGRSYSQSLHATQSFYMIPDPPTVLQLALEAGADGLQQALRRLELVLLICVALLLGLHGRNLLAAFLIFALAQMLGQGLCIQNWMAMSPFWARMFCSLTTLLMICGSLTENRRPADGQVRRLWIPVFLLGMLYGASQSRSVIDWALSTKEQNLALVFGALGVLIGLGLLAACVLEAKLVLRAWQGFMQERMRFWIAYGAGISAAALFWYEAGTPAFVDGIIPVLPAIFWVAIGCLGLWCQVQGGGWSGRRVGVAGIFFGLGLVFGFTNVAVPLLSLVMLVFLAFLGVSLLFSLKAPGWLWILMVALGMLYFGFAASSHVRDATAMPIAHVVGVAILFSFLFFICYRIMEVRAVPVAYFPVRVLGLLACALAVLWRLMEYRGWFQEEIVPELVMGSMQLPVLTLFLLVGAALAWPRKRGFQVASAGGPPVTHWLLLGLAFFALPHGTLSCSRPFFTPHAPTPNEARHIMGRLLTDTYLAFNVTDENLAFDTLETNLSDDLIADVYLDSRRRLSAGTRQGAKVTVKQVQVRSVDEVLSKSKSNTSFTYPCQWVVTARVKHLKHVHDRQNIYLGELTIGIEDDQWKITKLVLKNEERIIKPWKKA